MRNDYILACAVGTEEISEPPDDAEDKVIPCPRMESRCVLKVTLDLSVGHKRESPFPRRKCVAASAAWLAAPHCERCWDGEAELRAGAGKRHHMQGTLPAGKGGERVWAVHC